MQVRKIIKLSQKRCRKLFRSLNKFNANEKRILKHSHSAFSSETEVFKELYKTIKDIRINTVCFIEYNYLKDNDVFGLIYAIDYDIDYDIINPNPLDEKKSKRTLNNIETIEIRLTRDNKKVGFMPTIIFIKELHNISLKLNKNGKSQENNQRRE